MSNFSHDASGLHCLSVSNIGIALYFEKPELFHLQVCFCIITEAEKTGSDIIERIAESRRLRHEEAIEDMHQELHLIADVSEITRFNVR